MVDRRIGFAKVQVRSYLYEPSALVKTGALLLCVSSAIGSIGCNSERNSGAAPSPRSQSLNTNESKTSNALDACLAAWRARKKDEAVRLLLAAEGEDLARGSTLPVFQLSESDVAKLPRERIRMIQEEVIEIGPELKKLGNYCIALGNKSLVQGDAVTARRYFEAVNRLGCTLKFPHRVLALHGFGNYLVTTSAIGIERCKKGGR